MVSVLLRVYLLLRSRDLAAVENYLQSHCLTTGVFPGSALLAFSQTGIKAGLLIG
jgi:hypothetical protein